MLAWQISIGDLPKPLGPAPLATRNQTGNATNPKAEPPSAREAVKVDANATNPTPPPSVPACVGNTVVFYYEPTPAGDVGFGSFLNRHGMVLRLRCYQHARIGYSERPVMRGRLCTLWTFLKTVDEIQANAYGQSNARKTLFPADVNATVASARNGTRRLLEVTALVRQSRSVPAEYDERP